MRVKAIIPFVLLLSLSACGGSEPQAVPDLRGKRLDVAERRLDSLGLDYERVGGGTFGIVVRSNWTVCDQQPRPGTRASEVTLVVGRYCPPPPPKRHVVPSLVGSDLSAAQRSLERRKIPYRVESWDGGLVDPVVAEVCDQQPDAGKKAVEAVLYAAADCKRPEPVVPDLVGEDLEDAKDVLADAGIGYRVVGPEGDDALLEVCDVSPRPGERAPEVTLEVARKC
jgi:beta-lactam-binding protein with PASTA domain